MARSHNDDRQGLYFKQGSRSIILKQGDIFDEKDVDAIVIPTPDFGQQASHTYPLFEALCSRADQNLKEQIKKFSAEIKRGGPPEIIWGIKPSIILTSIPYFGNEKAAFKMLQTTYSACLKLAVSQKIQTIAFPTIGCGKSSFTPRDAATNLHKALNQFEQSREKILNEIRIIIYDKDIYNEFTNIFMNFSEEKNAKIKFIEILTKNSTSSEMAGNRDKHQTSQRQSQENEIQDYSDDFDDLPENSRDRMKRQTSNLNPRSPEFQPKNNNQGRPPRHYRINNNKTELIILQGDILKTNVDAIVNAANESMLGGGGVDGVIHRAAGDELRKACKAHKQISYDVRLPTGRSRILLSYNMSKTTYYIINTAGPRYDDDEPEKCRKDLTSCYETSLALANLYDLETIGFTAISCGIFGYPIHEGAEVALAAVDTNAGSMRKIFFVLKEDDIYDAWVKKAEQLQFTSLDDSGAVAASISRQSSSNTRKTTENPSPNEESKASEQPSEMRVIDGSTSNSAQKSLESNRDKSPENPSPDPNETLNNPKTVGNEEDDSATNKDKETKNTTSERQKNDSREEGIRSDDSNEQRQAQNKNEKSQPRVGKSGSNKSIVQGGVYGRGKKK